MTSTFGAGITQSVSELARIDAAAPQAWRRQESVGHQQLAARRIGRRTAKAPGIEAMRGRVGQRRVELGTQIGIHTGLKPRFS